MNSYHPCFFLFFYTYKHRLATVDNLLVLFSYVSINIYKHTNIQHVCMSSLSVFPFLVIKWLECDLRYVKSALLWRERFTVQTSASVYICVYTHPVLYLMLQILYPPKTAALSNWGIFSDQIIPFPEKWGYRLMVQVTGHNFRSCGWPSWFIRNNDQWMTVKM